MGELLQLLLCLFGVVLAVMPLAIYSELRRQGRQRSAEASRMLYVLNKIARILTPEVVDSDPEPEQYDNPQSRLPSGRRVVIRRT